MQEISSQEIMVSIICVCYNHEKYIKQCLDGFMMQQCNFKFEVLIHDDASTDVSANIIREYEKKYPDIIKPIYQKENKFSSEENIWIDYLFPKAKGKYIAMCDGDDYWTDPLKLQKQVDFLESNKDCNLVYHRVQIFDEEKNAFSPETLNTSLEIQKKDIYDIALQGNPMHTPAVLFRNNIILPRELFNLPVGDYILWFLNAEKGKLGYLPDEMAVYRFSEKSTWAKKSKQYRVGNWLQVIACLKNYTKNKQIKILFNKQAWNTVKYDINPKKLSFQEKIRLSRRLLNINFGLYSKIIKFFFLGKEYK